MSKSCSNNDSKKRHESKSSYASPTSILSYDGSDFMKENGSEIHDFTLTPSSYHINLENFIQLLPDTIRNSSPVSSYSTSLSSCYNMDDIRSSSKSSDNDDPIASLFRRLTISKEELKPYYFTEEKKNYTRNLIATDNETFTLLLLCWNPGKYSPIHDHPCNGCWMRVCQGCVNEVRYRKNKSEIKHQDEKDEKEGRAFECIMDTTYSEGEHTFIDDNLGYHKVGNPSCDLPAVSMHLYSPPFDKCKIWMNSYDESASSISCMYNFSEYGHRIKK